MIVVNFEKATLVMEKFISSSFAIFFFCCCYSRVFCHCFEIIWGNLYRFCCFWIRDRRETNDWDGKSCLSTSSKPPSLSTFNPRQGSSPLRRFNSSSSRISTKNKYPIRNEDETNEQTAEGGDEVNFLFHFPLPCFQVPVLDLLPCS